MAWRTTDSGLDAVRLGVVALLDVERMRDGIVVQTGDVPERERQVGAGLAVRPVEDAILGGMLVGQQVHVEGRFDGRNRSLDLHLHAIARSANHGESMLLNVTHDCVILFLRGAKPRRELGRRQEVPEVRDGRAVQVGQEVVEAGRIAEGQNHIQLHDLGEGKPAHEPGLAVERCLAHVACVQRLRTAGQDSGGDKRCDREQHYADSLCLIHNSSWHSDRMGPDIPLPRP